MPETEGETEGMSRTPVLAANWKMQKTVGEAGAFLDRVSCRGCRANAAEVVVCPPFMAVHAAVGRLRGDPGARRRPEHVLRGLRRLHRRGLAVDAADAGVQDVILGHSERRRLFGETDEALSRKVPAALAAGSADPLRRRERGAARRRRDRAWSRRQIEAGLSPVEDERLAQVVIAYEPIWAIGTGRTATPEQAEEAPAASSAPLSRARSVDAADAIRILYGGSVKPGNAAELLGRSPTIDGALVGGASLDPADFIAIVGAA